MRNRALQHSTEALLRLPPHSIESEQSLIGGLLLDNAAWDRIDGQVSEADFYRDDHRRIFRHILALLNAGRPADVVTVFEAIEKANEIDQTGGIAYLGEIANATPSAANIARYAEVVHERAVLRRLVTFGDEVAAAALNPAGREVNEIIDEAEQRLYLVAEAGQALKAGPIDIRPVLGKVIDRIQEMYDREDPSQVTGLATGYVDLDKMTSGLQPGDVIVIAGRPSMGKTALALNIAEHVTLNLGKEALIFSMEMSAEQLGMRLLSSVGRIDQQRLKSGNLGDEDWDRLTAALSKLSGAAIHIDDSGGLSGNEVRSRARRHARRAGGRLGLIVIDYLQLMSATKQGENRATEISEVSRTIKAMAKELGVPVLALSQLSRKVEERNDKRPVMSDLRESGAIEQDADVVLMMYRDEYYKPDTQDKGVAEAIIAKQRTGPTGVVKLSFLGEYTRFENFARMSW